MIQIRSIVYKILKCFSTTNYEYLFENDILCNILTSEFRKFANSICLVTLQMEPKRNGNGL